MPRRFAPTRHLIASSHRSCFAACRSLRASPLLRPVIGICSGAAAVQWLLASRPASSTRRAGRYNETVTALSALLACSLRLAIPSVRFGIGWRRGSVLASLDCPMPATPMAIIGAACYLSDFLIVLPPHRLPPRSLDTGDGAVPLGLGCLSLRFYFACYLFVLVLCIAVAGVALLA